MFVIQQVQQITRTAAEAMLCANQCSATQGVQLVMWPADQHSVFMHTGVMT